MTKRKKEKPGLSAWQGKLLSELQELAGEQPDRLRVLRYGLSKDRELIVDIDLDTATLPREEKGFKFLEREEFRMVLPVSLSGAPQVGMTHRRFRGVPHALGNMALCIYLDPAREWDPREGAGGILNRIWGWMEDAAAGRLNPATAMYHAVGGVIHDEAGTPTIVVRGSLPERGFGRGGLVARTDVRKDLTFAAGGRVAGDAVPYYEPPMELFEGAGTSLKELCAHLDRSFRHELAKRRPHPSLPSEAFLCLLRASALRNSMGCLQHFLLGVRNRASGDLTLLGGSLPAEFADQIREGVALGLRDGRRVVRDFDDVKVTWCQLSDERVEISTRRDASRPVRSILGSTVFIAGCGGLGSWMAELIVRAGAKRVVLSDPGLIKGGLLVRQNYVEDDIGSDKATALAGRLRAISDSVIVEVDALGNPAEYADVIVDATVSKAFGLYLDSSLAESSSGALVVRVAVNSASSALGVAVIAAPGNELSVEGIDSTCGSEVLAEAELEPFHGFWDGTGALEDFAPARGCSVPTFHGSAADLVSMAGVFVNLIGKQLASPVSGVHLVSVPPEAHAKSHVFRPLGTAEVLSLQGRLGLPKAA